jgi:hypothetical protein
MDRSIHRFLCLPIFDDTFRSVLKEVGLDRVEFWLAMSDDVSSPDEKFSSFLPALTGDDQVINAALLRLDMVNLLADMVSRSAKRVQEEIATDLGYGSAEPPRITTWCTGLPCLCRSVRSQVVLALRKSSHLSRTPRIWSGRGGACGSSRSASALGPVQV